MKLLPILLLIAATPLAAQVGATAETLTIPKPGGVMVLHGCTVTKVESSGVKVTHSTGIALVPWSHMPEGWKAVVPRPTVVGIPISPELSENPLLPAAPAPEVKQPVHGLLTTEQVKASWLAAANPDAVSGLHNDGKREVVGGVKNVATAKSKFKGAAGVSDAEKKRQEILKYRADILAGVHDKRAQRAALENNVRVYEAAGQKDKANECRAQLMKLGQRQ
jgi:hypothetical protein